jgi:ADP-L-glycero-D-manno-heptose 6-epimerase
VKVVVTGAAGMIGSNLVHALDAHGADEIIAVDDLTDGSKFRHLLGARVADYLDRSEFYQRFARRELGRIEVVFHQGALSDTMEHNGRIMLETNYRCSKDLLDACQSQGTRLLYASSAAVYGASQVFREQPEYERPLNVYGFSKLLFDDVVRRALPSLRAQVVGLRYFNVYGPREQHKGRMASVAFHQFNEFREAGKVRLFGAYGGYGAGKQERDFIHVDDVIAVNLWFLEHPESNGVFNVGTGRAQPFNDVAHALINACRALHAEPALSLEQQLSSGLIEYVPFPPALVGKYQCHTRADLTALRAAGCQLTSLDVAAGVGRYVEWLARQADA